MTRARLSEGYKPEFDIDYHYGREGEQFVLDFLNGFVKAGGRLTVEVKRDGRYMDTGNLYLEVECKRRDGWHDSGIRTSTADMWSFVLGEMVIVAVPTRVLRHIVEYAWQSMDMFGKPMFRLEEKDGSHPTRGVRLPLNWFLTRLIPALAREWAREPAA